jgi:hypothetical protein
MTDDMEFEERMRSLFRRDRGDTPSELPLDAVLHGGERRLRRRTTFKVVSVAACALVASGATISVVAASTSGTAPSLTLEKPPATPTRTS